MNENIIRMAREAGFEADDAPVCDVWITDGYWAKELERFAALVAAAEREECAKVCENMNADYDSAIVESCAEAIRARGEQA